MKDFVASTLAYITVALVGPFLCVISPRRYTVKDYFRFLIHPSGTPSNTL